MWNLKRKQMNEYNKTETNSQMQRAKQWLPVGRVKWWGGAGQGQGARRYKLNMYKINKQQGYIVQYREIWPLFYDNIFLINLFYLCIYFGCFGSSLLHEVFLQLWRVGATPHRNVRAPHCSGLSCCRARALGMRASVVVAHGLSSCGSWALECRLSSCGAWTQPLCSMWDLPRLGLKPVSPALAGGFFFF